MTSPTSTTILIIDDEQSRLDTLSQTIAEVDRDIQVASWCPSKSDTEAQASFEEHLTSDVRFVAADHDLTKGGPAGLFGSSIAAWCSDRYLPMCYFSRRVEVRLPRENGLFEFRISDTADESARAYEIVRLARGFAAIRQAVSTHGDDRSLANLLATVMSEPALTDEVAPYLAGVGFANSQIIQDLSTSSLQGDAHRDARTAVQAFLLGHILANAVLEFPGPVMNAAQLCAYCGTVSSEFTRLEPLFEGARYRGPFSDFGNYFVRVRVNAVLDGYAEAAGPAEDDVDAYNRAATEHALGVKLTPHSCDRCDGVLGGYWCPFTRRPVCSRPTCSVGSTSWIPKGATMCRVEHNYFEELAPLLGN